MNDYIIRGTAAEDQVRFFAAYTKDTVEFARTAHKLSPVCTAALGRLLTAGTMMGSMMKSDSDRLTIKIDCDGPIQGLLVTADCEGNVKGYVKNPDVYLPPNAKGKLDVAGALDLGVLSVVKDFGLKDPYIGQTILVTSEIAEDLTYYFASSEQTPSSVALGVLVNPDGSVQTAGGFIIQMMPSASDEVISALEERLQNFSSVTSLLQEGKTPEDIISELFSGMEPEIMEKKPCGFHCNCSREKSDQMLRALPKNEIQEMIDEGKEIEVSCHFCNSNYRFSVEELQSMLQDE